MLASLLRLANSEHFNLKTWCCRSDCTACAVGTACVFKYFNDRGLHMGDSGEPVYTGKNGIEARGWEAVCQFFGLESAQATYLFSSDSYPDRDENNPIAVADRIEQYLKLRSES